MTTQTNATSDIDPPTGVSYDAKTGKAVGLGMNLYATGYGGAEVAVQWHLRYLGDISKIWQDYTGRGVSVAVYDTGVQAAHWDLAANMDTSKQLVDDDGNVLSGEPVFTSNDPEDGAHGTACAGLIAAARNGRGGVGVAYGASLTGVNVFDEKSDASFLPWSISLGGRFDVISNSWGFDQAFGGAIFSRDTVGGYFWGQSQAVRVIADNGRDGLGTIFVKAAGNDGRDGTGDGLNNDRHVITVAAYRQIDGVASSYSNNGSYLLVSAPSSDKYVYGGTGLVTTDLLGWRGYISAAMPACRRTIPAASAAHRGRRRSWRVSPR
ncbi:S8 family serine peptidase [Sphingomonas abaci]|uniref:Peptidase S8/S53 domain-containing protein n=1 Tax=Sphingomonas abaci TaxID=237611 RepID=A0A7W7ALQ0_9SPHN|nr:S8 family serine peptidase [Sphingomonas abaci]MBB4619387.1 hypothetical protein [Sphingomonas abaci]